MARRETGKTPGCCYISRAVQRSGNAKQDGIFYIRDENVCSLRSGGRILIKARLHSITRARSHAENVAQTWRKLGILAMHFATLDDNSSAL